jgi:hypothetical protein
MKSAPKNNSILNRILSMAMLLLYVAAFFVTPTFEHHHHEKDSEHQCSANNEVDPCHRVIFHNDLKQGCEHDEHFSEHYHSCDVCDKLLTAHPKLIINCQNKIELQSSEIDFSFLTEVLISQALFHSSARAPPAFA